MTADAIIRQIQAATWKAELEIWDGRRRLVFFDERIAPAARDMLAWEKIVGEEKARVEKALSEIRAQTCEVGDITSRASK